MLINHLFPSLSKWDEERVGQRMGHQMQEWDHIGDAIGFDTFSFVSWFSNAVDLGMVVVLGGFERIND